MPASTLKWQSFNQKKPYFIATIFGVVAVVGALGFLFGQLASVENAELEKTQAQLEPMRRKSEQFKRAYNNLQKTEKELEQYGGWVGERYFWVDVLSEVRSALMRTEAGMKARYRADTGVWIEQLNSFATGPSSGVEVASSDTSSGTQVVGALDAEARRRFMARYGLKSYGGTPAGESQPQAQPETSNEPKKSASNTNEVSTLTITFKAVSLSAVDPGANSELVFSVIDEIRKSPLFDEKETTSSGNIGSEESPGIFSFGVNVKLKRPLKL